MTYKSIRNLRKRFVRSFRTCNVCPWRNDAVLFPVNPAVDGTADAPDEMPKMAAVIGGQEFEEGKWPWMASLQVQFVYSLVIFVLERFALT